jgi:selenocysteine lyase/cysteine desulfurase
MKMLGKQVPHPAVESLRSEIVGIDQVIPLLDGSSRIYVNLDNAASTPSFRKVQNKVNELLVWYSSVHRGTGLKSLVSTHLYDRAHEIVAEFVGADPQLDCVIFGKNTTEAINTLAQTYPWQPKDVVITSLMEHHSDDLPWRANADLVRVGVDDQGALDLVEMEVKIRQYAGRLKFVAITGASNVTGFTPPVHRIAEWAHQAGAMILVDCAQLGAHRKIDMRPHGDAGHLDFISLSGHKMYAPFGTGALVGPKDFFDQYPPSQRGGGTIEIVTTEEVYWADPPERNEAGSPNVVGAVAMATALNVLSDVGMEAIAAHEKELTHYFLSRLQGMTGVHVYGSHDSERVNDRLGVVAFEVEGVHHGEVAAILGFEAGIAVRNGCFCAHPYLLHMMDVTGDRYAIFKQEVLHHDRRNIPGLVRASLGCYNTCEEIDYLADWLDRIVTGKYDGIYFQEKASGAFFPKIYDPAILTRYLDY